MNLFPTPYFVSLVPVRVPSTALPNTTYSNALPTSSHSGEFSQLLSCGDFLIAETSGCSSAPKRASCAIRSFPFPHDVGSATVNCNLQVTLEVGVGDAAAREEVLLLARASGRPAWVSQPESTYDFSSSTCIEGECHC